MRIVLTATRWTCLALLVLWLGAGAVSLYQGQAWAHDVLRGAAVFVGWAAPAYIAYNLYAWATRRLKAGPSASRPSSGPA